MHNYAKLFLCLHSQTDCLSLTNWSRQSVVSPTDKITWYLKFNIWWLIFRIMIMSQWDLSEMIVRRLSLTLFQGFDNLYNPNVQVVKMCQVSWLEKAECVWVVKTFPESWISTAVALCSTTDHECLNSPPESTGMKMFVTPDKKRKNFTSILYAKHVLWWKADSYAAQRLAYIDHPKQ